MRCPLCHGPLERGEDALSCTRNRLHSFPVVQGVPVFTEVGTAVEIRPAEHVSHQPPSTVLAPFLETPEPWLHLGAGATIARYPNSIELETAIFRNTDVTGDAARLPFRDASLGGVLALNVFEHLADPAASARQLHRVLVPGSPVIIQTAFLQPLHSDPHHFYNATEQGIARWFQDFDVLDISIPSNFHPAHTISWMASELLAGTDSTLEEQLGNLTLRELASFWRDSTLQQSTGWATLLQVPEHRQRVLAAGFQLTAMRR